VIRFSAFLVVVAVGLLVAGVVTSKLLLVYIAIGVSGVALLALGVGVAVNWRELTSKPKTVEPSAQGPAPIPPDPVPAVPAPAVAPAAADPAPAGAAPSGAAPATSGWPVTAASVPAGPSRAGYLPAAEPPPRARPPAAPAAPAPATAFTPRRETQAPGVWEWRDDPGPAEDQPPIDAGDKAKPATTEPEPEPEPEPDSGAGPAADSDLTLITAAAPAAAGDPAISESKQGTQDKPAREAEPAGPDHGMEVTVVPGVPRYHNARCILIRFMGDSDLDKMTLAAARDAGCTPCRACLPDQPDKSPE